MNGPWTPDPKKSPNRPQGPNDPTQLVEVECRHLDVQIDAVEKRARDPFAIAVDERWTAGARVPWIVQVPAWTFLRSLFCHVTLRGRKPRPGYLGAPRTVGEHLRKRRLTLS